MTTPHASRAHGRWLWFTLGVFVARVVAQPAARLTAWPWLPGFDAWQSGALPYGSLLAAQLAMVVWMARSAWQVSHGQTRPVRARGRWVGAAAALYAVAMLARLLLGLTVAAGHWWLDAPLPTLFHLVIASYLAVYAHYHWRAASPSGSRT